MRRSVSLAVVLSVLSSGCATPQLLSDAAGVDWDDIAPPPQSRIVPDRIAFCANGTVELHAEALAPPDVTWRGHGKGTVRVIHKLTFRPPDERDAASSGVEYRDLREGVCGPVANTVRLSLAPAEWRVLGTESCTQPGWTRLFRDQALSSDGTAPVPPELLDVVPARSIEVVVPPDDRASLPPKEPRPIAYAALPLAVAADTVTLGVGTAGLLLLVAANPIGMATAAPFLIAAAIRRPAVVEPPSKNLDGQDLTRKSFRDSDELAGATLRCATLAGVDLRKARLSDANLENTRLVGADLRGADLSHVRNLTQRQLAFACVDAETRLPPGLTAPLPCF